MARQAGERIHVLEIPLSGMSLLLPSASIAEIVSLADLARVPFGPNWLLGITGWRTLAVPVVSFEALMGQRVAAPTPASKIAVIYPLPGRADWEFTGILTLAEPRPRPVEEAGLITAEASDLPDTPYVAAGLKSQGRLLAVPDLEAMKRAFYPA
jgi:chemosensory pili system protein ChpC